MRLLISLLFFLSLIACSTSTETRYEATSTFSAQEIAAMHDEVIVIHDEVMPKIEDIYNEKLRLAGILETTADSTQQSTLSSMMQQLDAAEESMMQWMREFKPQQFAEDTTALIEYYNQEKVRIEEVRSVMLSTLEEAQSM